jgi:hypothetical protein
MRLVSPHFLITSSAIMNALAACIPEIPTDPDIFGIGVRMAIYT